MLAAPVCALCWRGPWLGLGLARVLGWCVAWRLMVFRLMDGFGFGLVVGVCGRPGLWLWLLAGLSVCDEPESLILAQSERWRHA